MKRHFSQELEQISGVGKIIAEDLRRIGIHSVNQLKGQDPSQLYEKLCNFKASPVDKCVLYILRCVIYYASNIEHEPELLKWWNWKNKN